MGIVAHVALITAVSSCKLRKEPAAVCSQREWESERVKEIVENLSNEIIKGDARSNFLFHS